MAETVSGQLVLAVSGGAATGGYATLSGAPFFSGTETLDLVSAGSTYEAGDGTVLSGSDNVVPIDENGLIFGTNVPGRGGHTLGIWNNGGPVFGNTYQGFIAGPGGGIGFPPNLYGYTGALTVAAPEPATWAMLMLGFGWLGFAALRKDRQARAIA